MEKKISLDGMLDPVHGNPAYLQLNDSDRSLVRAILLTTLRYLPRLEASIGMLLDTPLPEGARTLHYILVTAAAQIMHLDVPEHSVVDVAVEQANRDPRTRRFAKLVNAVLRRLVRERQEIANRTALISPVPTWFLHRLTEVYGSDNARKIIEGQLIPPAIDLTIKSDPNFWTQQLRGRLLPTGSIRLPSFDGPITTLAGYHEGAWWIQDAAASIPVRLFGDMAGKRIADLCAAPGGKTAQLVVGGANVIAVEQSANRLKRLKENLDRLQLSAQLVQGDLFAFTPEDPLDGVLLDAPCSSTGTTRRHPDVLWTKGLEDIAKLATVQATMLRHAVSLVRPGGIIVFSNCSLDPLEGEQVVADILAENDSIERVPVNPEDWPGLENAISTVGEFRTTPAMIPQTDGFTGGLDGFFASVLRRK